MASFTQIHLQAPYLIFIGDTDNALFAKTGVGMVDWCPEKVVGQHSFAGNSLNIGVEDLSLIQAKEKGAKSLLIGVAPVGGNIGAQWIDTLVEAATLGLDIISGLHFKLEDFSVLKSAAQKSGARLINIRTPPENIPIGNGQKRTGKRVLMVGSDCALGKKYTALAMSQEMSKRKMNVDFRATGQTGIMIAGSGIPIDAVVSDFIAGAAEIISPANSDDHWDVIEGQGSLFNPAYAGVTLGLIHGSQPDAIVVCHHATRTHISSVKSYLLPSVKECIEHNLNCAKLTNSKVKCIGISVNTSDLPENKRQAYLENLSIEVGLPCIDPIFTGCSALVDSLVDML